MPSKKHRPIVMNRNKRPDKSGSIFKKAVLITALLAFIEITVLLFIHFKNTNKAIAVTDENAKETPKVPGQNTRKVSPALATTITAKKQRDTVTKKDTVKTGKAVAADAEPPKPKTKKDTAVMRAVKQQETKAAKPVSQDKMFEILNQVRIEKLRANNTAKCISIKIISSSNAENGFQIANYLRRNGYVISGREVIPGSQKGILIDAGETCIKLSVGDL